MVWSMTLEFIARALLLDFSWVFSFIAKNVFWVFAFAAIAFFVFPNKKLFYAFIVVVLSLWVAVDFTRAVGWVLLDPSFLAVNQIVQIGVLMFAESDEKLKKNFAFINTLRFIVVLSFFNLFLR